MGFKLFSTAATGRALKNLISNSVPGMRLAVAGIMEQMANDAKERAPDESFIDITGNLRNSIEGFMLPAGTALSVNNPDGAFQIVANGKSDEIFGVLVAGMDYGIHVELRDDKNVIGATVKKFKPRLAKMFGREVKTRGTYKRDFE